MNELFWGVNKPISHTNEQNQCFSTRFLDEHLIGLMASVSEEMSFFEI
jgi:hypothetical protein